MTCPSGKMPFPHSRFAVKASQKTSSDESSSGNADSSAPDETSARVDDEVSVPNTLSSASTSATNVSNPLSPLGLLKSRYPDAMQNFEETAGFFTAKVKRIFRNNFGVSEEEETTQSLTTNPVTIKNPTKPENDAPLEDSLLRSIHEEARRREEKRTPGDRLRAIFKTQPSGGFSPEMNQFKDVLVYTLGLGLFLGYYRGRKEARKQFIKLNMATKYTSNVAANRKLNDFVISAAIRNGINTSIPLLGFMAVFTGSSICLSVYENEEKLWHMCAGASFAGANNRIMLGPRAFVVGGLIGGFLGLGLGAIQISLKRLAGLATLKEKRYHRHVQEIMEEMYEDKRLPAPPRQFELYNEVPE